MTDGKDGKAPGRSSWRLCNELQHFMLLEQKKRKRLGLPHDKLNDILNDLGLAGALSLGYKVPEDPPLPGRSAFDVDMRKGCNVVYGLAKINRPFEKGFRKAFGDDDSK